MASMRFEDETTNQVCMMMHDAYMLIFSVATSRTKPHVDDGFIEKTIYVMGQHKRFESCLIWCRYAGRYGSSGGANRIMGVSQPSQVCNPTCQVHLGMYERCWTSHWVRRYSWFVGPNQVLAQGGSEANHRKLVISNGKTFIFGHPTLGLQSRPRPIRR